jgi:LPS export ABC transporter protein LptC
MNHKEIERWYRLKNIVKACQVLVVASVVLMVAWYAVSRFSRDGQEEFIPLPATHAGIRIENFSYSSPGVHPWELQAESAVVSESMDRVSLTKPRVVYTGGSGGKIYLQSKTGELDRKTQNVTARGDVAVTFRDFRFTTDEIQYSQDKRVAETASAVSLEGTDLRVSGKGLRLSIEAEEITVQEDVKTELLHVRWFGANGQLPML